MGLPSVRRLDNRCFCSRGGAAGRERCLGAEGSRFYVPRRGAGAISVSERHPRYVASVSCRKEGRRNSSSGGLTGASERYLGGPNGAGRRGAPRPSADKTDSSLRKSSRPCAHAVAGTRSGPRASALVKDHRGAAQAPAFRRRRAPTGWAASQPPNDDAHAVDDAVVDAAPRLRH